MLRLLPFLLLAIVSPALAAEAPPIVSVEGQPLAANVRRVIQAFELLGAPLPAEEASALEAAAKERNAEARVVVHRGLVVPEDREALNEVAVAAGLQPVPATDRIGAHLSVQRPKVAAPKPEYSEALMRKLTAHRTAALQAVIANSPQVATALLVEKLVSEWCSSYYCERSS